MDMYSDIIMQVRELLQTIKSG